LKQPLAVCAPFVSNREQRAGTAIFRSLYANPEYASKTDRVLKQDKDSVRLKPDRVDSHRPATPVGISIPVRVFIICGFSVKKGCEHA